MNVNFEKVKTVTIVDENGQLISTFNLGSVQLTKPDWNLILKKSKTK